MPEIWLSYGEADVVLDIPAENLGQDISPGGEPMPPEEVEERLAAADLGGSRLVAMHCTDAVLQALSAIRASCERRSAPMPEILAEAHVARAMRGRLPDGASVSELGGEAPGDAGLVFLAEAELDGLFGYETVSTRLARRFGRDAMLSAYAKRAGNLPAPGRATGSAEEARKFADGFEVRAVEIAACPGGIMGLEAGHPSSTSSVSRSVEAAAARDTGGLGPTVVSTGKAASGDTLSRSLSSLWGCREAIRGGAPAVLLAESGRGLGSEALRRHAEGRMGTDRLRSPARYVDGMEDLLFLREAQKSLQVCLVSVLPESYVRGLGMVPFDGAKAALGHALGAQGRRRKADVVRDGARTLLR